MKWSVGCTLLVVLWEIFHLAEAWCGTLQSRILYSRDHLLKFDQPANSRLPPDLTFPNIADIKWQYGRNGSSTNASRLRSRKRGRRGGLSKRARRPLSRVPLPSIILANMQSLRNKSDEVQAHVRYQHEFKEACILALTETWLGEADSDAGIALDGFGAPFRMDRVAATTGKSRGGGVCLYINERWCKITLVREKLCTKDIELLSLRPFYLPREFPQIFVTVVYKHPKVNEGFNHCSLDEILKCFFFYVCPAQPETGRFLINVMAPLKVPINLSISLPWVLSITTVCILYQRIALAFREGKWIPGK